MTRDECIAVNKASLALGLGLAGMTWDRWILLTPKERAELTDNSGLTPQLKGYEGCRVEVIDANRERRRFYVGKSSGWRPCHLEIHRVDSTGGVPAASSYQSVIIIRNKRTGAPVMR